MWPAGAKPGDHFEYTVPCATYYGAGPGSATERTSVDILRVETLSVGGRDVVTLFVREELRWSDEVNPHGFSEEWVFPDHYLVVNEHARFASANRWGEYWLLLDSLNPS